MTNGQSDGLTHPNYTIQSEARAHKYKRKKNEKKKTKRHGRVSVPKKKPPDTRKHGQTLLLKDITDGQTHALIEYLQSD